MDLIKFPIPDARIEEVRKTVRDAVLAGSDRLDQIVEEGKLIAPDIQKANALDQKLLSLLTLLD